MDLFLQFVSGWAAKKILDKGFSEFSNKIDGLVDELVSSPVAEGWQAGITDDQRSLINTLRKTTPSRFRRFAAALRRKRPRPIVLLGPSGVGKTCVALRLAGKTPDRVAATINEVETEKFVVGLKAINVISPSGYRLHGDYLETIESVCNSRNPPSVVCMVVCGGFHATAKKEHVGTLEAANFSRPGHRGAVPSTIAEFRETCFREEELYLTDVYEKLAGHLVESIPWVITIVNKRDLWWHHAGVLDRYQRGDSAYSKALDLVRGPKCFGAPDGSTSSHIVFPAYLSDDGFGPDPSLQSTALRQAHMESDAMVLRALVFNKYARGSG